ncbi:MAG: GrpB family protein [Oligoflexia bacterium]|nr:GrpB family protein [Oligoflexia bacterium]
MALIEDYFQIRGWWYRGPKESFCVLEKLQPKIFEYYERALRPNASHEAISNLVSEIDRDLTTILRSVVVEDYNPLWAKEFAELKAKIWPHVCDIAISIEHVGSTAVPGLAAKPIIDIDIVISSNDTLCEIINRLQKLGYDHRGDMGVAGREAFRHRDTYTSAVTTSAAVAPAHHLYVCLKDSLALKNHLILRDYLLNNQLAREEYGELKRTLAKKFPTDIDHYVDGKSSFIISILQKHGLELEQLQEIEKINTIPHKRE